MKEVKKTGKANVKRGGTRKKILKANFELVKAYLDKNKWFYNVVDRKDEDVMLVTGGIGGLGGLHDSFRFMMVIGVDEIQNYAIMPMSANGHLAECAEFISRINYGLKYGAFEMDYCDGEVRFHLTYPIEAVRADTNKSVEVLLSIPSDAIKRYINGLLDVLTDKKSPEEAVVMSETGE